jgi:hypothetical protein
MGQINRDWHLANPMPKKPTEDERLNWHLQHLKHCGCRTELPKSIVKLMAERGLAVPSMADRKA